MTSMEHASCQGQCTIQTKEDQISAPLLIVHCRVLGVRRAFEGPSIRLLGRLVPWYTPRVWRTSSNRALQLVIRLIQNSCATFQRPTAEHRVKALVELFCPTTSHGDATPKALASNSRNNSQKVWQLESWHGV